MVSGQFFSLWPKFHMLNTNEPNAAGPTYSSMYYVQRHTAKPVYTVLPELAILSSLTYAQREENMQLKFASLLSFALLAIFASGTPVPEPDPASLADGAYMFRRSSTGSGLVITPLDLATIGHGGLNVTTENKPKARDISLAKRDSIACFQASVNGADKGTAVGVVANILTSFPVVPANTGIGVVIGNSIAYVCNNAGAAQAA
ncbi:hypothetical protein BT96DRAFT_179689 [Gymnopus androsaceus JB14]|uniref:Uncharacterized protein n=1 Tax=Gymnopus androsaceus JB14 TaxID=1447944 RepID=A0A6A4HAK3_9AGAR|nr:hypothetical protein BT96DRAFT_179689 [Gymnopus androsaceus JB14]